MRQIKELSTSDPQVKSRIEKEISRILDGFSLESVPPDLSNEFHRAANAISKNSDPFRERKLEEMERARKAFEKIEVKNDLRSAVEIAAMGNAIDFFVDPGTLGRELSNLPNFAVDDVAKLWGKLEGARDILYLADNAGEVYFDLPLVNALGEHAKVTYVVKAAPVQNDLTLEDLRRAGLDGSFEDIIEAPATVGVYLERASPEFRDRFERADLVVAKGMGNYETLSELPESGKFFYILRAKCGPVARSLGVNVDDYVAMLR
jgi:hypothetical protein